MRSFFHQAAPVRGADEMTKLDHIDGRIKQLAVDMGGHEIKCSTLVSREMLERAEYPRAFPHLLFVASQLLHPDIGEPALLERENLASPAWCLSPAVCYHVYAHLANSQCSNPLIVTVRGRCFRNEAETVPGVRQIEFEMREIVLLGTDRWVEEMASSAQGALEALARKFELSGKWEVAEDPFFLPKAEGKVLMQRLLETKLEYCIEDPVPMAVASVNRHGTFFGERFGITDPSGRPLHTACIAAGLDRWLTGVTHCERR